MAEAKKKHSTNPWYIQCLNWCWNHRLVVTGIVAAIIAIWFWRFWLLNYGKDNWIIDCWYLNFIEGTKWLNVLIFTYTIYVTLIWGYYACQFNRRWYHLAIYALAIATIWAVPAFEPVATPISNMLYHYWATCLIGLVALAELSFLIYNQYLRKDVPISDTYTGFVAHLTNKKHQSTGWDNFADTLIGMVGSEQLQKESFTIGIASSWGSGKTTFYETMKYRLEQNETFSVCEFKPWQVVNHSQLSSQFFSIFKQNLIKRGVLPESDLISDISKYAGVLESLPAVSSYAKPIVNVLRSQEDASLQSLHDQIEDLLVNCNFHTAVMIDDLDRLNKNELMEVLRLIRVSANFRNVLFIITYDKDYIAQIIGSNGKEYLKKIVNVEINLPPIETYKYREILIDNIQRIVPKLEPAKLEELKVAFQVINNKENEMLYLKYSRNFRDIFRFSNHFGLVLNHLQKQKVLSTYNIHDLFWLEMLRYYDEETYYKLQNKPFSLLTLLEDPHTHQQYLALNDETNKNENLESKSILVELFDVNRKKYTNTIVWMNNYHSYFAHRQLDNTVSMPEFVMLIEQTSHSSYLHKQVHDWYESRRRVSFEHVVMNYPHNNTFTSELAVKNYTRVLFDLYELNAIDEKQLKDLFQIKCRISYFRNVSVEQIANILRKAIAMHPAIGWNYLLTAMCSKNREQAYDTDERVRYILTQKQLNEYAILNYTHYFAEKKCALENLFKPDTEHTNFMLSLQYIAETTGLKDDHIKSYGNLLGNYVLNHYAPLRRRQVLKKEAFHQIIQNLLDLSKQSGHDDLDVNYIHRKLEKMIGSVENFELFVRENFKLNDTDKIIARGLELNV